MEERLNTKEELAKEVERLRKRLQEIESSKFLKKIGDIAMERQELLSIFDSVDEPIYVSDPVTYEILYVNQAIKTRFGNVLGQKCFKVFQDLDKPCPFCTNDKIFGENIGRVYVWDFQNKVDKNWYRCIDKAIRWADGRMVRYEIAIKINDIKQREMALAEEKEMLEKMMSAFTKEFEKKIAQLQKEVNSLLEALGREKKY